MNINKLMFDNQKTIEQKIADKTISSGTYDGETKSIVLTFTDGTSLPISVADLINTGYTDPETGDSKIAVEVKDETTGETTTEYVATENYVHEVVNGAIGNAETVLDDILGE